MLAAALKKRVRERELTFGPMLTFDFWPGYLEIFKAEGMHYAVLDMEHGAVTLPMAEELCRTARLLDFPLIIRPEASLYHVVRKYIDMGAAGFLLPWTERQEQMDAVRDAVFTPPRGRRGPGGPSIFHNRTLDRAGWDEVEDSLFIMPQIESPAGIEALASITAPDWVDSTMLGPYDLSLNLNVCGQMDHPELVSAIETISDRSRQAGKPCGMVVNSPDQARAWISRGFHFFIYCEVSYMVRAYSRSLVRDIQDIWRDRVR